MAIVFHFLFIKENFPPPKLFPLWIFCRRNSALDSSPSTIVKNWEAAMSWRVGKKEKNNSLRNWNARNTFHNIERRSLHTHVVLLIRSDKCRSDRNFADFEFPPTRIYCIKLSNFLWKEFSLMNFRRADETLHSRRSILSLRFAHSLTIKLIRQLHAFYFVNIKIICIEMFHSRICLTFLLFLFASRFNCGRRFVGLCFSEGSRWEFPNWCSDELESESIETSEKCQQIN